MVGGDDSLLDPLFRAMIRCGALEGKLIIATDDAERAIGVSVWFGPGHTIFATSVQFRAHAIFNWLNFLIWFTQGKNNVTSVLTISWHGCLPRLDNGGSPL